MTIKGIEKKLIKLFHNYFFEKPVYLKRIKGGVSDRVVYKIASKNYVCIGVHNAKLKENEAFIEFSKALRTAGFNVPEIYSVTEDGEFYIEEFAGEKSLFDLIKSKKFSRDLKISYYKKALSDLAEIQLKGLEAISFKYCYETKVFNKKQIFFDFNKFHNFYLQKLTDLKFSKKQISGIKNAILENILKEKKLYFMYRDFQPRNIMLKDGSLYYIDYQSGRKGPLQYDVASFLYSGSIELDEKERNDLLNYYIKEISAQVKIYKKDFKTSFYYFALIRLLQVLGSYGFIYEKSKDKNIFKKINKALKNIVSIQYKLGDNILGSFIEELVKYRY